MKTRLAEFFGFFENQLHNPLFWVIVGSVIVLTATIFVVREYRKFKRSLPQAGPTRPKKPSFLAKLWEPVALWFELKIERIKFSIRERHQRKLLNRTQQNQSQQNEQFWGVKFPKYNYFAWRFIFMMIPVGIIFWITGISQTVGQFILLFSILHLMFGKKRVTVNEYIVIDFMGIPLTVLCGNAAMIIIGCRTTKFSAQQVQTQYPSEPENIFWDDEKKDLPAGKARPVRFSSKMPTNYDPAKETDPLKMFRYTIAVSWTVTWQIKKSEVIKFWKNVGSEKEAVRRMRDQSQETLKHEYGKLTPDEILGRTKKTGKRLEKDLEILTGDGDDPESGWGINVIEVNIVEDNLGHTTASEQAQVSQAQYKLLRTRKENLGKGDEERQKLIGRADGMKKIQENLKTEEGKLAARITLASETVKNADYTIVPDSDLFKTLTGAAQYINRPQKKRRQKTGGANGNP